MVGTSVKLEAVYVLAFSMVQQHKKAVENHRSVHDLVKPK